MYSQIRPNPKEFSNITMLSLFLSIALVIFSHINSSHKFSYIFEDIKKSVKSSPITFLSFEHSRYSEKIPIYFFWGFEKACEQWVRYACGKTKDGSTTYCSRCALYYSGLDFKKELYQYDGANFYRDSSTRNYLYYLEHSTKSKRCKNGFKLCGKLDEINNMCVPENELCPITDMIILPQDKYKDYEKINYKPGLNLFYSRNSTSRSAIVGLNVSEGQMCAYSAFINSNNSQFEHDNRWSYYGCEGAGGEKYDWSYTKINEIGIQRKDFLVENGLEEIFRKYPKLTVDKAYTADVYLYARRFIGFDKDCLRENDIYTDNFEDFLKKIEQSGSKRTALATVCLVTGYSCIILSIYSLCKNSSEQERESMMMAYFYVYLVCFIINFLFFLALRPYIILYEMPECADELTNKKAKDFNALCSAGTVQHFLGIVFVIIFMQLFVGIYCFLRAKNFINEYSDLAYFLCSICDCDCRQLDFKH